MDSELREILATCIGEMDSGSSMEACLQRYPEQASELRPHLTLWSGLASGAKAEPESHVIYRGQRQMLAALSTWQGGSNGPGGGHMIPRYLAPAAVKVAAVVAGAMLLLGGAAGVSAALGGPDPAGSALNTVGIVSDEQTGQHDGENSDCPSQTPGVTPTPAATPKDGGNACRDGEHQDKCTSDAASPTPSPTPAATPADSGDTNCDHQDTCAASGGASPTPSPTPAGTPLDENDNHEQGAHGDCNDHKDKCASDAASPTPSPTPAATPADDGDANCDHQDTCAAAGGASPTPSPAGTPLDENGDHEANGVDNGDCNDHKDKCVIDSATPTAAPATPKDDEGDKGDGANECHDGHNDHEEGINHAPDAAEHGKECANQNAFEGSGNSEDKSGNRDSASTREKCNQKP